jgi:hypothetical protein
MSERLVSGIRVEESNRAGEGWQKRRVRLGREVSAEVVRSPTLILEAGFEAVGGD